MCDWVLNILLSLVQTNNQKHIKIHSENNRTMRLISMNIKDTTLMSEVDREIILKT